MTTEYVTGVGMTRLSEGEKRVVTGKLLRYVDMLHSIESKTTGSPKIEGPVIPPYRAMNTDETRDTWPCCTAASGEEYVILLQRSVAGKYHRRLEDIEDRNNRGLGVALERFGDRDDEPELFEFLKS